jgi:AbrB family looped-hinge helix DNA binding protein
LSDYQALTNREAVVETSSLTSKVGKRGAVVIPAPLRRRFGIEEGTLVVAEATEEGILIRPAVAVPVEVYSPERKARLLLENATDAEDFARAAEVVREELGLDPNSLGVEPPGRRASG